MDRMHKTRNVLHTSLSPAAGLLLLVSRAPSVPASRVTPHELTRSEPPFTWLVLFAPAAGITRAIAVLNGGGSGGRDGGWCPDRACDRGRRHSDCSGWPVLRALQQR